MTNKCYRLLTSALLPLYGQHFLYVRFDNSFQTPNPTFHPDFLFHRLKYQIKCNHLFIIRISSPDNSPSSGYIWQKHYRRSITRSNQNAPDLILFSGFRILIYFLKTRIDFTHTEHQFFQKYALISQIHFTLKENYGNVISIF